MFPLVRANDQGDDLSALKVGIIGGSIAGSAMGALLARAGCVVTVLERDAPTDRGAGIGVPKSVVDTLVARDLVDADTRCVVATRFPRIWRTEKEERYGRVAWDQAGSLALLNWGALYRNLRKRVPVDAYLTACKVNALREDSGAVVVELADGRSYDFDLVVCADGYGSIGRQTLFPNVRPAYVGYVLWRGVLSESELTESAPLEGAVCWPSYRGGHGPFSFVPGLDGSIEAGRRLVNWGLYMRVTEIERAELLTGKDGTPNGASLPPGTMAPAREANLKLWAREVLPEYYAEIVGKSTGTFVQPIYECAVPAYRKGRICLAGDAAALARPHTGTGVLKGITDAITLADALTSDTPLDEALALWSEERTRSGNNLVKLGAQLGRALVDDAGDGSKIDAQAMQKWFSSIVTVPTAMFATE